MQRSAQFLKSAAARLWAHRHRRTSNRRGPAFYQLRSEPLEDRRMLAVVTVDTELDIVDGADGLTSLREAIAATNAMSGADDIVFDFGHDGPATILLELGELEITDALTITGDGADLLTIDAQENSRVIDITADTGDFTFAGLTLTGGKTGGMLEAGGAIRSSTSGSLTLTQSAVTGNSTTGDDSAGGGIYADGAVTLNESTVSGNHTDGDSTRSEGARGGGGIWAAGDVTLSGSTVSGNSNAGEHAWGGGIATVGNATLSSSTISGNSTTGRGANAGGIYVRGDLTLIESVVSENSTTGFVANAGGMFVYRGELTLLSSTVSGNFTTGYGASGGGIYTNGMVTLTSSTVSGNFNTGDLSKGGGIRARLLMATDSTISDNASIDTGGGVDVRDVVTLIESVVHGNSVRRGHGGGVASDGTVTSIRSTISHNFTEERQAHGGGIWAPYVTLLNSTVSGNFTAGERARGGGIRAAYVTLSGSTVSGNASLGDGGMGGGIYADKDATISGSTVTGNLAAGDGGGIFVGRDTTLSGSIVAGNVALVGSGPDVFDNLFRPETVVATYSLIGDNAGSGLVEAPTADAMGNLIGGTVHGVIDAGLAPLADNGGLTLTHAVLPGSPAIDAGNNNQAARAGLATDQRGFLRGVDGDMNGSIIVDMGAFEFNATAVTTRALVVDTMADDFDFDFSLSHLSLREATGLANGIVGLDTIDFDTTGVFATSQTITLVLGEMLIFEAVTINGPGANNLVIDAQQHSRIFNIAALTGDITIAGVTLTGGKTTGDNMSSSDNTYSGGGIRSVTTGKLTIDQSNISGNSTEGRDAGGGGIYARGAVTLTKSSVSGNSTSGSGAGGGGIYDRGGLTLTESTVSGNSTTGGSAQGGGLRVFGDVTLSLSTVSGNSTTGSGSSGGGMYVRAGGLTLTGSTVSGNSTSGGHSNGGGIWASLAVTLSGSIVAGNEATGSAGPDVFDWLFTDETVAATHSLIGDNAESGLDEAPTPDAGGNLIGGLVNGVIDPLLAPLANNGGPTQTHALLPGSPAIDAGDPAAVAGVDGIPKFDQRGAPFVRVGAVIDMGAFEVQLSVEELIGEYVDDGIFNRGQANSLLVKLTLNGNGRARPKRLQAFFNQVDAFVQAGILTAEQGDALGYAVMRLSMVQSNLAGNRAREEAFVSDGVDSDDPILGFPADKGSLGRNDWQISIAFDAVFEDLGVKKNPRHRRR